MKEPLGRIHPHGSGGKSVYQRAAQESNQVFSDAFQGVCWLMGAGIVALVVVTVIMEPTALGGIAPVLAAAYALMSD